MIVRCDQEPEDSFWGALAEALEKTADWESAEQSLSFLKDDPQSDSSPQVPSEQWGVEPMEKTDENWGRINSALRHEAVKCYQDYVAE